MVGVVYERDGEIIRDGGRAGGSRDRERREREKTKRARELEKDILRDRLCVSCTFLRLQQGLVCDTVLRKGAAHKF